MSLSARIMNLQCPPRRDNGETADMAFRQGFRIARSAAAAAAADEADATLSARIVNIPERNDPDRGGTDFYCFGHRDARHAAAELAAEADAIRDELVAVLEGFVALGHAQDTPARRNLISAAAFAIARAKGQAA